MIEYQNPFYNVFRINADTPNEYYLIDNKRQYTIDTVPTSPFNVDKSSFEQLKKYKSKYIGDNSNTSHLPYPYRNMAIYLKLILKTMDLQ